MRQATFTAQSSKYYPPCFFNHRSIFFDSLLSRRISAPLSFPRSALTSRSLVT